MYFDIFRLKLNEKIQRKPARKLHTGTTEWASSKPITFSLQITYYYSIMFSILDKPSNNRLHDRYPLRYAACRRTH